MEQETRDEIPRRPRREHLRPTWATASGPAQFHIPPQRAQGTFALLISKLSSPQQAHLRSIAQEADTGSISKDSRLKINILEKMKKGETGWRCSQPH